MSRPAPRAIDAVIGAGSILTVLAGLTVLSQDVRSVVFNLTAGDPAGDLPEAAAHVQAFAQSLVRAAADYRAANAPLVGFGVVAVVLAFLMFKT